MTIKFLKSLSNKFYNFIWYIFEIIVEHVL